jgi:YD repeat-containing protein
MSRQSYTNKRRAQLKRKFDLLDRLENRNTITEPISVLGLSMTASRGLVQLGIMSPTAASNALHGPAPVRIAGEQSGQRSARPGLATDFASIAIGLPPQRPATAGGGSPNTTSAAVTPANPPQASDWLTLGAASKPAVSEASGISSPWHPAARAGGGVAMAPRGGSGNGALPVTLALVRGQISPLSVPKPNLAPSTPGGGGSSAALLAALASASQGNGGSSLGESLTGGRLTRSAPIARNPSAPSSPAGGQNPGSGLTAQPMTGSGGGTPRSSIPDPVIGTSSGPSEDTFPYFNLYVIDVNNGVVLFPGADQLATFSGHVDLEAQVSGATVSSYSWNTSDLAGANDISGTSTNQLTFQWEEENAGAAFTSSVTLSVTDTSSQIETYTYDFWVPSSNGGGGSSGGSGGSATWPAAITPESELLTAPSFASDDASVDATSGALDTEIDLPSYNPNVPALALTYDSVTADPLPIILVENTMPATVPSTVSAQLTYNSSGGSTWYYSTSSLNPGDVQQIALQAPSGVASLATGRYSYSAVVTDSGSTPTTLTGSTTLFSETSSPFGDGWTLEGLEQITSASGGVTLSEGDNGRSLWFTAPASGGTYTDPAGEFSTLVKNSGSGGGYTRTLTDGTQITFNSGGYETATIDLNGLHTTYSYNGSNQLTSIEDPYGNYTTLTYSGGSGGHLQTIEDPAGRITTLTNSGGELTQAELPDGSTWGYAYSGGLLTKITDPRSNAVSIVYDSAGRVGTIALPEGSNETFTNDQESGWTDTGTSGSPAAATLLAQATSTYTSPNGNTTTLRPDWWGLGQTGVAIDAIGDVATYDLNSNGLATVAIDQVNRVTSFTYDSKGNMTEEVYPDGSSEIYTYNSDAEPLTYENEDSDTYQYTYDSHGNLTVIEDPLDNLTTMTYTSGGMVQTVEDANKHTTTYQYDSQNRLTTIINADSTTEELAYNSQSNVISSTDERANILTYSYDMLNRETGMTDALHDVTTLVYDSGGNLITDEQPTPSGQTARTTSYAYDSMNRMTTITDPLGYQTVNSYDADGNLVSTTDPMSRITTTTYDALDRPVVTIDAMNNRTTIVYDGDSEVTQVTDPLGRITTTTYDNRGWVATVTDPLGNVVTYSYTNTGKIATETNPGSGGYEQSDLYDKDDRLISYTDQNNNTTTYAYNGVGNMTGSTDPNGHLITYVYNSVNEQTEEIEPNGVTVSYTYDASGNQQTATDALGHTTTMLYDALDRVTTIVSAISGTTTAQYDSADREVSSTDPDGNTTQWAYDSDDRLTTLTQANGATVTYVYDKDRELTDTTDADGRRTTYSYNSDGDNTGETWLTSSGGALNIITYSYDADNELTGAADSYATLTMTYDSGGNEISQSTSGGGSGQPSVLLSYTYDKNHDITSVEDNLTSQGIVTYAYDAGFRLTTVTTSYGGTAGPQVLITYAPDNQITSESRTIAGSGTAVNTSYSYDANDRQTTITDYGAGGSALATYVYSYDDVSRVTTLVDADGTYTFTYDNANELTNVDKGGTNVESYSYDANGNRTGTGYSTTVMNETLTSPGVITYAYDKAGNMISQDSGGTFTTFTYDYRNRLTGVEQGGTFIATYVYNALNQRIGINDSGGGQTWTVYDGKNPFAEPYADFNSSGTLTERYLHGPGVVNGAVVDELLARTSSGGTTAWYLTDKLGSVRDIVSSAGTAIDHIVYDSFGNIVTETSASNGDRFKFAGMQYDYAISYCSPCIVCHCSAGAPALPGRRNELAFPRPFDQRLLVAFSPSVPWRLAA